MVRFSFERTNDAARLRGYALIAALILVVGVSLAVTLAVQRASFEQRRERERELLFVGLQFRKAFASYAAAAGSTGTQAYPKSLDDLIQDKRGVALVRHLRRIYPDPVTGKADWILDTQQDRVVGVHSRSLLAPVKRADFPAGLSSFALAKSYQDWRFVPDAYMGAPTVAAVSVQGNSLTTISTGLPDPAVPDSGNPAPMSPAQAENLNAALAQCTAQYGGTQSSQCYSSLQSGQATLDCLIALRSNYRQCVQAAYQQ